MGRAGARGKESTIFDTVGSGSPGETFGLGAMPGSGTYFCVHCGVQLSLRETDSLPACPRCGSSRFRRDSIFLAHQEHGETTAEVELPTAAEPPEWLPAARRALGPGRHLAYRDDAGQVHSTTIERGWTRIGRSPACDLVLDDPSVSRRHALIVAEPGEELRVLDDRSLNGVLVNGVDAELSPLRDGDRLTIGRFQLYAILA
ncbi:MAG TPA: FHA domain-containing protein [Solirubrobacterales bacterium]|nr:FHA domain-containing protein [Solirubrobacterales bacterium]